MTQTTDWQPGFTCSLPVRWGDMDAYGHVNNVAYMRYLEEARVQLLGSMGKGDIAASPTGPVVVTVGCTYLVPLTWPDTLRIECGVAEPGRSSLMVYYRLYSEKRKVLSAEAHSKLVWIDKATGTSVPLPDDVRAWVSAVSPSATART